MVDLAQDYCHYLEHPTLSNLHPLINRKSLFSLTIKALELLG
jgi:hypothetical protein